MRAFSYGNMHGHFRSRDKDDSHTIRSAENPMLRANFMTQVFYRTRVIADRSFTFREWGFWTFLLH